MKKLLMFVVVALSLNVAFGQGPVVQYGIEAKNMIYGGVEKSFIVVTITNDSDKELEHKGYGFTAENFSATDSKGNKLMDSAWVAGLRPKKRYENPIIVPARGKTYVMYTLDQLFKLETNNEITVVCGLSGNMKMKIEKPK